MYDGNNALDWWAAKKAIDEQQKFVNLEDADNDTDNDTDTGVEHDSTYNNHPETYQNDNEDDKEDKEDKEDGDDRSEYTQAESDALKLLYMQRLMKKFNFLSQSFIFLIDDFTGPLYRQTHNDEDRKAEFEQNKERAFARVIKEEDYIMETSKEVMKECGELVCLLSSNKHED